MIHKPANFELQGGFTLLELLVVITIFGFILVALTSGVRFAGRAWETQERIINQQGDLDAVQNALRQIITSGHSFDGDATSLRFVGRLPRALERGGLFDIELHTSQDRLVATWVPHFKGPAPPVDPAEAELARNVSRLDLAYYLGSGDAGGWQFVSQDKKKPPALIAISLKTIDGRQWPPLVVAPMIEASFK